MADAPSNPAAPQDPGLMATGMFVPPTAGASPGSTPAPAAGGLGAVPGGPPAVAASSEPGSATGRMSQAAVLLARKALIPIYGTIVRCPRCGTRLQDASVKQCPHCGVDPGSADAAAMLVPQGSLVSELFRGASYVPRGAWRILVSPKLWLVALVPFVFNVAFMYGMWKLTEVFVVDWFDTHTSVQALQDWNGLFWGFLALVLKMLGLIVHWLSFIMVPLFAAWLMTTAPFRVIFAAMSTLVGGRTEQLALQPPTRPVEPFDLGKFQAALVISIVDAMLLALLEAVLYLVLSPIAVIPFVGTFLWFVFPRALFAALDQSDPSFCRKGYYTREKIALWRERPWRFLGFGLSFFLLLVIPIVNAFVFPVVAAGGALLYLELDRK